MTHGVRRGAIRSRRLVAHAYMSADVNPIILFPSPARGWYTSKPEERSLWAFGSRSTPSHCESPPPPVAMKFVSALIPTAKQADMMTTR